MTVRHLLLPALLIAAAMPASAENIRIDFVGVNSSPAAANVFGTPIPNLTGYVIYDSATSASGTTGSTATNYANAIKELGFSLGGNGGATVFSGSRSGSFGSVQVRDAAGSDTLSFNQMTLTSSQLQGEVPAIVNGTQTRTFNNAQLTLSLSGPPDTLSTQALPGIFDPAMFSGQKNLQVFLSYTQQPGGTAAGNWPAVSYNYNLSQVTAVPEPGTFGLLFAGLGAVGVLARRRRIAS